MTENHANREYMNSVFIALCEDKRRLVEVYNAVSNKNYPLDIAPKIVTLDNVLFWGLRNDVAFLMEDRLVVLMEHQSTVCENMPFRLLLYIGGVYEKWLNTDEKLRQAIYGRQLLKIPRPEFYVLYNGKEKFPERKDLRLSDAFWDIPETAKRRAARLFRGLLELVVPVYNINKGFNAKMLGKSATLSGYAFFVDLLRKYAEAGYTQAEAARRAIEDCIEQGILADFLREHASEVINVLTWEFNLEDMLQVRAEEAKKEGKREGKREGKEEGKKEGKEEMAKEMAKNLLASGVSPDIIAESAGMPLEKIQALIG